VDLGLFLELAGLGLSAFDPIGVAVVILLLTQPNGVRRAWAFLLGSIASLMVLGWLVATGLGRPILRFREQYPWLDTAFELAVGVVLVGVGVVLLRRAKAGGGLEPEFITSRLRVPTPLLVVLGFLLVTVQNALDAVFVVAMVETGQRNLSGPETLLAVAVFTVAAVLVQVLLVLTYQLLPAERREATLDRFNTMLEMRGEQVAGWLALGLGAVLLVVSVSGELFGATPSG
jgi:threonine/homoserine/homoserine lactone efflux protein